MIRRHTDWGYSEGEVALTYKVARTINVTTAKHVWVGMGDLPHSWKRFIGVARIYAGFFPRR